VGLDHKQVRTWTSWHRWSTAALTAYALLVIAALHKHHATTGHDPPDLIPITCPEIQHLLAPTARRDATKPGTPTQTTSPEHHELQLP
jgi:hypothetical protein